MGRDEAENIQVRRPILSEIGYKSPLGSQKVQKIIYRYLITRTMKVKKMKRLVIIFLSVGLIIFSGCANQSDNQAEKPPELPKGILIDQIPKTMDIIFTSIRYVLDDTACLDKNNELKDNFIHDADCNKKIYSPEAGIASPRQLFVLDVETGDVIHVTNTDWFFVSGQVVDSHTIMANAVIADTNKDGIINDRDKTELYLLDLKTKKMECLTSGLDAINNPDYSCVTKKIVFSARKGSDISLQNHIYTIDFQKNLVQITHDPEYMDFDCSWSEDGTKIVFSRLPAPWFEKPSQVWMMDSTGDNLEKITDGGSNLNNEGPHGVYPIGIDADPDLSPDNTKIVFSRLKTGKENEPFGVYELIIIDVYTKKEEVLDSGYANMVPEWKSNGIIFIRQVGAGDPMERKQSLYLYRGGTWEELELFPYNVFPLGAFGGSWIELGCATVMGGEGSSV